MGKMYNTNYGLELARAKIFNALSVRRKIKILDALELSSGDYLPKSKMADGPFVVYGGGGLTQSTHSNYNIDKETIGIGRVGARCGCVFKIKERSWVTDNALYVSLFKKGYDLSFLMHYLNFQNLNQFANQSAQPVISQRGIASCTIPDIDLGEQIIIGRILNAVENQEDFEDAYGLKPLLSFEKDISALQTEIEQQQTYLQLLRQAILQEAVQGKLTPQVETDEPASELLGRIKAEKQKLVKEGKLKKEKELPPITEDEILFELPKGWVWCRLGEIALKVTDGTHHSPTNVESGEFMYVTAKNIKNEGVDQKNITYVTREVHDEIYSRCNPEFGDILYIKDGATTGIATINNIDEPYSMLSSVALIKLPDLAINKYILYCMRSPYYYSATRNDMAGIAITRVTLTKLVSTIIPLPPLSEQEQIVAKVDKLMKITSELEQQVSNNQAQAQQLLQAVLKEAFERKGKVYAGAKELTLAAEA